MSLPNGIDGISEAIGTLFGATGPLTSVPGAETWGSNPVSQMNANTQTAVMERLKANVIRPSPGWNGTSSALYQPGVRSGIPYTLALLEQFVSQVTGLPVGTWETANEALLALEGIASNKDLQANWTTIFTDLKIANASELAARINNLSTDIADAGVGNWDALLADLGLSDVPGLATFLDNASEMANKAKAQANAMFTTPNMVLDPGFEQMSLWNGATGTQTTNTSRSGVYSWQLVGQG